MNKTSLTDIPDMARERKIRIKPDTKVPNCLGRWQEGTKYINWEKFAKFCTDIFLTEQNKLCLIRIKFKLDYWEPLSNIIQAVF